MNFSPNKTPIEMVGFSGILGTGQIEYQKMIKRKLIDGKKIVSRFRGKLVKIIRDVRSKFDDYSISPKIRQIYCIGVMN